jgi:2-polyprenyl-6-methoxyphenol hydroxylase-like FAD-dependent oxidoreductase
MEELVRLEIIVVGGGIAGFAAAAALRKTGNKITVCDTCQAEDEVTG